jgi:hypothetical protein
MRASESRYRHDWFSPFLSKRGMRIVVILLGLVRVIDRGSIVGTCADNALPGDAVTLAALPRMS